MAQNSSQGTSLSVQWLRLCAYNAGGAGSIPGRGTKIPHAAGRGQKKKTKQTLASVLFAHGSAV